MALNLIAPRGYHVVRDLAYGADPRQKLDLYVPGQAGRRPRRCFSSFMAAPGRAAARRFIRAFGQAFASKGIITAVADYRLYPQVRYPAFVEDGARAFAWLHAHAAAHGGDPNGLFLAGHSAGAYIAVMLAADRSYLKTAGADPASIRGVIGISGPYDFLPLSDDELIAIFGGANRPETQPIHYIDGVRPPMLLATGTEDTIVSPGNTSRLAAQAALNRQSGGGKAVSRHRPYRDHPVAGAGLARPDIPLPRHAGLRASRMGPRHGAEFREKAGKVQFPCEFPAGTLMHFFGPGGAGNETSGRFGGLRRHG